MVTLDPTASPFVYSGEMIFMGPTPGVCFEFQFGKCSQTSHHDKPNGDMQLHICQPCYQIRQLLVHHTCAGRHPGHHGGERRVGAFGCPDQISPQTQSPTTSCISTPSQEVPAASSFQCSSPSQQLTQFSQQQSRPLFLCKSCGDITDGCTCESYRHTPDALCSCADCSSFVRQYSYNLEKLCRQAGVEVFDLYSTFYDYHSEVSDDDESEEDNYSDNWDLASTISSSTIIGNESFLSSNQNLNYSLYSDYYH